jgi:hypothetical protein
MGCSTPPFPPKPPSLQGVKQRRGLLLRRLPANEHRKKRRVRKPCLTPVTHVVMAARMSRELLGTQLMWSHSAASQTTARSETSLNTTNSGTDGHLCVFAVTQNHCTQCSCLNIMHVAMETVRQSDLNSMKYRWHGCFKCATVMKHREEGRREERGVWVSREQIWQNMSTV